MSDSSNSKTPPWRNGVSQFWTKRLAYFKQVEPDLDFLWWTEVSWDENENIGTQQSQKPNESRESVAKGKNGFVKTQKIGKHTVTTREKDTTCKRVAKHNVKFTGKNCKAQAGDNPHLMEDESDDVSI